MVFLSLPTIILVVLHGMAAPGILPEFLGFIVVWAIIALTGFLGAVLTLTACVVAQSLRCNRMLLTRPKHDDPGGRRMSGARGVPAMAVVDESNKH